MKNRVYSLPAIFERVHVEKQTLHHAGQGCRYQQSESNTDGSRQHSLLQDQAPDGRVARAEREADADFASALCDAVGENTVQSHRCKQHGKGSEGAEQQHVKPSIGSRAAERFLHLSYLKQRKIRPPNLIRLLHPPAKRSTDTDIVELPI